MTTLTDDGDFSLRGDVTVDVERAAGVDTSIGLAHAGDDQLVAALVRAGPDDGHAVAVRGGHDLLAVAEAGAKGALRVCLFRVIFEPS